MPGAHANMDRYFRSWIGISGSHVPGAHENMHTCILLEHSPSKMNVFTRTFILLEIAQNLRNREKKGQDSALPCAFSVSCRFCSVSSKINFITCLVFRSFAFHSERQGATALHF